MEYFENFLAKIDTFRSLYCQLWTYFTLFTIISIVEFQQLNACWEGWLLQLIVRTQLTFTCLRAAIETLEKGVKYVQC